MPYPFRGSRRHGVTFGGAAKVYLLRDLEAAHFAVADAERELAVLEGQGAFAYR